MLTRLVVTRMARSGEAWEKKETVMTDDKTKANAGQFVAATVFNILSFNSDLGRLPSTNPFA